MTLWASADLGTNTFRLLVAEEVRPGALVLRELRQKVVRLGEGLRPGGRLAAPAADRAEALLRRFRDRLDALGVERRVGVLAAAGRAAADGPAFAERAAAILGGPVRIVSGEEEAALSARGAVGLAGPLPRRVLFVDIGGGSTEVVVWTDGRPRAAVSLPVGVVGLWEAIGASDPPTREDRERMGAACRAAWDGLPGGIPPPSWRRDLREGGAALLATAGTPLTVAAMVLGRPAGDTRALSGAVVGAGDLRRVADRLWSATREERAGWPSVEPGREDVILAGVGLLEALVERVGSPELRVSDGGLLEGVLLEAVEQERGVAGWADGGPGDATESG